MLSTDDREWLETNGLGGFSSGTVNGIRTRRYHALLLSATTPPTGRIVLVNGLEAFVTVDGRSSAISSQFYAPDTVHPDGATRIESFKTEPWPTWIYRIDNGIRISFELFAPNERDGVVLHWQLLERSEASVELSVRLLMSGRDYHALHHENLTFDFAPHQRGQCVQWSPYPGIPAIRMLSNSEYTHDPVWYHNFLYQLERERGLDDLEDLASPGLHRFDLNSDSAVCILTTDGNNSIVLDEDAPSAVRLAEMLRQQERQRRGAFESPLARAGDAYLVRRGTGKTIIAGYPWFADWGRDTFIALRGLCLATGRLEVARDILRDWSKVVSEGMLPNRFPDRGEQPEFNSVDASLWYIIAVHEYLQAVATAGVQADDGHVESLQQAVHGILTGYSQGTRFGIHAGADGLLACGEPGVQLTWMDAKVGDWVVTPRIGKPVEVQTLWINALWIGSQWFGEWRPAFENARDSFEHAFWNSSANCLFDVVDVDHQPGRVDSALRPNQIFAVGGLPLQLIDGERARQIVDIVERRLLTPLGLRTLAPDDPEYRPHYGGGVWERDGAYHQGTVWPWLLGPFVEAWLRVRGETDRAKRDARKQFITPLLAHLAEAGIGHVSEIVDAEPTGGKQQPRGCPFQAWSVAELLRLMKTVLATAADRSDSTGSPVFQKGRSLSANAPIAQQFEY